MKMSFLNVMRKTFMATLLVFSLISFTSCNPESLTNSDAWSYLVNETEYEVQLNGNTLYYGEHVYKVEGEYDFQSTVYNTPTAFVSFSNIPSGYKEFKAVYENLLGLTPQGTAAMIPMAFEIYARNHETGEACLNLLCNSPETVTGIVRILKTKLVPSQYSPENDQYIQRYMPAALLKGAVNTNAYSPDEPYTVEMCASPNGIQDAPLTGGTVYYTYILAHGWDSFQRSVEIFQAYNTNTYKVFNCPSTYTQCKNIIGTWNGLK